RPPPRSGWAGRAAQSPTPYAPSTHSASRPCSAGRSRSPPPSQASAASSPSTPTATRPAGTRRGQSYSPEPLAATAVTQRTAPAGTSTSSPAPGPHALGRTPTPPSPGRSCAERRRCAEAPRSSGPSCEPGTHGPALTRRDHGKRRPDPGCAPQLRPRAALLHRRAAGTHRPANRLLPAHSAVPGHAPGRGSRRAHARHRCGHRWPGPTSSDLVSPAAPAARPGRLAITNRRTAGEDPDMDVARAREHRAFAALYDRMTGPLEQAVLGERRAGLLADLTGEVLDVGAGTGANLPYLRSASRVVAAE